MEAEVHGGAIRMSVRAIEDLIPEVFYISNTDTQGMLRSDGIYDEVKKKLLLPDSYIIHGIYYRWMGRVWDIVVESPDLPLVHEGEMLPVLTPTYRRNCTEELVEVRVEKDSYSY